MAKETSVERKAQGDIFRQRMKERRVFLNMSQIELSEKAGVSVDLIRAIENGRSANPGFFVAIGILLALKVYIGEAASWAGPNE